MEVQNLVTKLPGMSKTDMENQLEDCRRELKRGSDDFSTARNAYRALVQEYLKKFPPQFSEKRPDNLEAYHRLIGHSAVIGSMELLDEWGINYLRSKNFQWIDNPSEKNLFLERLQEIGNDTPELHKYFQYLIRQF